MSKAADAEQPTNLRTEFIAGVTTFFDDRLYRGGQSEYSGG
jgi:hypothetical protein